MIVEVLAAVALILTFMAPWAGLAFGLEAGFMRWA